MRTTPYTIPCMTFREGISHIVSAACRLQQTTAGYMKGGGYVSTTYRGDFMQCWILSPVAIRVIDRVNRLGY